ncbi:hypothetical protein AAFF_G00320380 [Aldrovandia affinis]|uniref:Uncharacterized protein n=1 Tax=Aldrovandia affinis TaxID=143900 RepID=A0AAD7R7I3_9TELE|nr:hypothetical protein AAFF_G00320380 [Aldrovandia affinis]
MFHLLNYTDRQAILNGARDTYPTHDRHNLLFFADYSKETARNRKEMSQFRRHLEATGLQLQPFLMYPAILNVTYRGKQLQLHSLKEAQKFFQSLQLLRRPHEPGAEAPLDNNEMDVSGSLGDDTRTLTGAQPPQTVPVAGVANVASMGTADSPSNGSN